MAEQINSNNDLDIKLGITIEDYATVATKIDDLIKKLQTDKKFTIKVDVKGINKQAEEAKKSLAKVKVEFDNLGRGYNSISKAMKKLYQDKDTTVSTSYEGSKRNVSGFTVSLIKAKDQVERLSYVWNDAKKGFVFDGKKMVDMSGINESIKQSKLKIERIAYDTKFKAISRKNSEDILNLPAIKAQIEGIKAKIKELDKLPLSQFKVEAQVITKEFANLQENILGAKAAAKASKSESKNTGSSKSKKGSKEDARGNDIQIEAIEVTKLSKKYDELYRQINKLYGDKGEISVISKNDLDDITSFVVKLKEADGFVKELKYVWDEESGQGFNLEDIKNNDTRQATREKALQEEQKIRRSIRLEEEKQEKANATAREKALQEEQKVRRALAIQDENEKKAEIERLNKINNIKLDYDIRTQNLTRGRTGVMEKSSIKEELSQFQQEIDKLDKTPLEALGQSTKKLELAWKQMKANIDDASAKEEKKEIIGLSREYDVLTKQIQELYGNQGELSIVSTGETEKIEAFIVQIKQADGFIRKLEYAWGSYGDSEGFLKGQIKNIDKRQELEEKALRETQRLNSNIAKQKEEADRKEVERLNQISNLRKDYEIKMQNTTREHSGALKEVPIANELKEFQQELKNLDSVPVDRLGQKTTELALAWKQLKANIADTSSVIRSQTHDTWIDSITKKTKQFVTWYISANAVMQSKNFLMDSVRQINEMDMATVELSKVTDLSSTSLNDMSNAAISLSQSLGKVNASEIMLSMAEFGRVTKDVKEIEQLATHATLASNVTSFTADEAAKAINTTVLAMNMNLGDSLMILDQFNEIQNNYRKKEFFIIFCI